jgi:hypothetical protein
MEHRGVRYEIKIAVGRSQWTWIVHTSSKPLHGSVEGSRQAAILAAEKAIDRWWAKRLRTMRLQATAERAQGAEAGNERCGNAQRAGGRGGWPGV